MHKYLILILLSIHLSCYCQNNDSEVLNYNTIVNFDGKNINNTYEYEIKINNGAGTKNAEVEIYYQLKNPPKNLTAEIYDIFGNKVRSLKKKEIVVRTPWSEGNFHTDHRVQTFKLIHNQFPYIIKYSYTEEENDYLSIAQWAPIVNPDIKTVNAKLVVNVPHNTQLNIYQQQLDSARIETIEELDTYTWEVKNYTCSDYESYSPHFSNITPMVNIMPDLFHYGIDGHGKTWKEFGDWKANLIKDLDKLTSVEINKVHQLTDTISNTIEKIKVLYHYMQDNTRYINISIDKGGLIPYPATYVCINRFGDCKALSNYMKALLNEINIEAFYTTIYSGLKPAKVNPDFPSHQSNHIILCIPVNNDSIWLECTDKSSPFNYLNSYTQDRYALTIQQNKSKLVKTPKHDIDKAIESYTTRVKIDDNNNVTFNCVAKVYGNEFDRLKSFDTHLSNKDKEQYIDHMGLIHKADISEFNIERPNRDSTWLTLELSGSAQSITENLGSRVLLQPFKSIKHHLELPEKRVNDVFVYYPINNCDTLIYEFPQKINEVKGISNITINSSFGTYTRSFSIKNNKLIISRTFILKQGFYSKSEYKDFYDFYTKSASLDNQKLMIN